MRGLLVALAGCATEDGVQLPDPPEVPVVYGWSDVAPIIAERCSRCHTARGVTSLPLTTWAEVQAARDMIGHVVDAGAMPPWPAGPGDFPFAADPTLLPGELEVLHTWIAQDGPLGDADPDLAVTESEPAVLGRVDSVLMPFGPYRPTAGPDEYRCFVLRGFSRPTGWISGLRIVVGNESAVHHARLSLVRTPDQGERLYALEREDPEPGFRCQDGMDPVDIGGVAERLATWLPGDGPVLFPEGSGMAVDGEPFYLLTIHYYVPAADGQPDLTRVELTLEDRVDRPVRVLRLQDPDWPRSLLVPAGAPDTTYTFRLKLGDTESGADDVEVLSAQMHMHRIGASGLISVYRDGERSTLLDIPRWDFDWQLDYWLETPLWLSPDDEVELTCRFDNSDGAEDVRWGEGSADEMCGTELYVSRSPAMSR